MISAKSFNDFAKASNNIKSVKGGVHSGEAVSKHLTALIIALILQRIFISSNPYSYPIPTMLRRIVLTITPLKEKVYLHNLKLSPI